MNNREHDQEQIDLAMNEKFITEIELAERWGVTRKAIQKFRYQGTGPTFHKFGRCVCYQMSQILSFEEMAKEEKE